MEPIYREFGFELRSTNGDGLTLEGYAAVFDAPTRISGWEGNFTEVIARGAFQKTIAERTPVLMFNHGKHPMIGDMPIGAITHLREDDHGLFVRARLADNWLVQPVRDAIANHSISGMSFRFEPVKDKWSAGKSHRTLLELRMPELGPVVMPAYEQTEVSVRSAEAIRLLNDPEVREDLAVWLLRDADVALDDEAVRQDTSDVEPPATQQEPVTAHTTTPEPMSKRDRLVRVAQLKGMVTNGDPGGSEGH